MSQKAIKKKTVSEIKHSMKISVRPAKDRSATPEKQTPTLPEKTFPLNKFIALPNGLRPKSNHSQSDVSSSTRRTSPVKAVAIPSGTSYSDSRAQAYVVNGPQATELATEAYNTIDYDIVNHNTIPVEKLANGGVSVIINGNTGNRDPSRPYATSTPRTPRRGYHSSQNSPRRNDSDSNYGSVNSSDSFSSINNSRKRRYKKRSQSAPVNENRRCLRDTDYVIQNWSEHDNIPGLSTRSNTRTDSDGIIIERENWTTANSYGVSPSRSIHTVYQSHSVNSPAHSVDKIKPRSHINGSSGYLGLEFTDVCRVNSSYLDNSHVGSPDSSYQSQDYNRNDSSLGTDSLTGQNTTSQVWDNKSDVVYTNSIKTGEQSHCGYKFLRSYSDFHLDRSEMEGHTQNMSSMGSPKYAVNGIPQSGIIIRRPGGDNIMINDMHTLSKPSGHDFYTVGRKQGTLMQAKQKFSSMPTLLTESKGDKKLLKLLKKQEKEEKKRREKEEKKRAKEEKKRIKLEKKLKTKTLPRNFESSNYQFTNGHVLHAGSTSGLDKMFRRPKLTMSAVPIDIEGDNFSLASSTPAPKMAPPPPPGMPGPSHRTMSLYASSPDLLRIEQVYGATLRGSQGSHYRPPIPRYAGLGLIEFLYFKL